VDKEDKLRTALEALQPDPRMMSGISTHDGQMRRRTLDDQHKIINRFVLVPTAPEAVRIHFETAKNLYLYAWFVYRFYMVSEHYVFSTLEMALRERLHTHFTPRQLKRPPSLGELLSMAASTGYIGNAKLHSRAARAMEMARNRFSHETTSRMIEEGIESMAIDYGSVQPSDEDLAFDWISHFTVHLPLLRNMHAHGSDHLYPNVLWTFEIVWELVNQLYADPKVDA
jgi:hypothetical protein